MTREEIIKAHEKAAGAAHTPPEPPQPIQPNPLLDEILFIAGTGMVMAVIGVLLMAAAGWIGR